MDNLNALFAKVREEFPALTQKVHGKPLSYLDSGATTLKPKAVIDRITQFYSFETSNVHRGAHYLGDVATQGFEGARHTVAHFLNAKTSDEIIFVRGTTEGMNLIAQTLGLTTLKAGDEILITEMEHHANIVPWQMIAEVKGATVVAAGTLDNGELDVEDFKKKLNSKTKIVSFTACSNVLGTNNDMKLLTKLAHEVGAKVVIDGAQIVSQAPVDVQAIDCDFFVFSAHKIFGPFGFGVVYGKKEILEQLPPYQGGGSMISKVTIAKTTYNDVPFRFEAGTPHVEGAVGLHAAIDFTKRIGLDKIHQYEMQLLKSATEKLSAIPDIKIIGTAANKGPILSFNLKGAHHSDVGQILDREGVAVRAGHHCCQPLMARFGVPGTVRASFSVYNNEDDINALVKAVAKAREMLL
ncbi:aminotransferase class V-fold PLP-dependent enzyme [Bdellovibrio sp. NC01]|uniref:aminotransferase class V-fold PLP-dependent enzyme n=1 Tax=Bdellovibrio sp. NC01 TaxID=2220073 RepID=UPI0011576E4E|nr:SufS family cysteine desulfurase [Bdellovibrio sp. NC01]QDK36241.1 cysteine desulfurase CsdA [Bdellovibrio sp. NC01]